MLLLRRAVAVPVAVGRGFSTVRTTRAAVCTVLGGPLKIDPSWPLPELLAGQVEVSVRAAGINLAEVYQLSGKYQEKLEPPFVPGNELAGVVARVGAGSALRVGDAVCAMPRGGGWAEAAMVDEKACMKLGKGDVDFGAAAALSCNYGTAQLALAHRADAQPGETVLVTAAAGGVGLAAVDLAVAMGCRVVAACGSAEKIALAKSRGATAGINYGDFASAEGFDARGFRAALAEAAPAGVDVAIDMVGGPMSEAILRSLNFEGRFVVVGFASGDIPKLPANLLLLKNVSAMGVYWGAYATKKPKIFAKSMQNVLKDFQDGKLAPYVGARFPLADAQKAVECLTARQSTGKIVLTMD